MAELSTQQRLVINNPAIIHVGADERDRPVVVGKKGTWGSLGAWALKRDGDPIEVMYPVRPLRGFKIIHDEVAAVRAYHRELARLRHPHTRTGQAN